jgi:hypothetical protein
MNPWVPLLGALAYNYRRHLHDQPTICSTTRRLVPAPVAMVGIAALFSWLTPHLYRGYPRPLKET